MTSKHTELRVRVRKNGAVGETEHIENGLIEGVKEGHVLRLGSGLDFPSGLGLGLVEM